MDELGVKRRRQRDLKLADALEAMIKAGRYYWLKAYGEIPPEVEEYFRETAEFVALLRED